MKDVARCAPRFTRQNWLKIIFILVLLAYTFVELAYRFTLPTDGWLVTESSLPGLTYIQNILGEPSSLKAGDRVIAVAGQPVDYVTLSGSTTFREDWQFGATLDYTVVRQGQEMRVPVTLKRWQLAPYVKNRLLDPIQTVGLLADLALLAIAAAIFLRRPDSPATFPFLVIIAFFVLTSWSETIPVGFQVWADPLADFLQNIISTFSLVLLFPYALVQFALVFPHPKPIQQKYPWLSSVVPVTATLLLVFTWGSSIGWFWFLFSLFLGLSILIHNGVTMRDPVSRAQIRWGVGGMLIGVGTIAVSMTANTVGLIEMSTRGWDLISTFATTVIGVMISIAIARYRLFDIDIIIRRTLQYTLLTGLLALVYFGTVLLLQSLVENLTGQTSPLVIVLSTLLIAALFNPLRRRLQTFIDRRFFRERYNAARLLAHFARTARDETELEHLERALVETVGQTMQPAHIHFWIRELEQS